MDGNRALKDKGVSSPLTDRLFVCYFFYFLFLTEKSLGEEVTPYEGQDKPQVSERTYIRFIDCPPKKTVDNETRT